MTPEKYVHVPTIVEAVQFDGTKESEASINEWALAHGHRGRLIFQTADENFLILDSSGRRSEWIAILPGTYVVNVPVLTPGIGRVMFRTLRKETFEALYARSESAYGHSLARVHRPDTSETTLPPTGARNPDRHQVEVDEKQIGHFHHSRFCESEGGYLVRCRYERWWTEGLFSLPAKPGFYSLGMTSHREVYLMLPSGSDAVAG